MGPGGRPTVRRFNGVMEDMFPEDIGDLLEDMSPEDIDDLLEDMSPEDWEQWMCLFLKKVADISIFYFHNNNNNNNKRCKE